MFLLFAVLLFFFTSSHCYAQIPLFYQLLQAYHPGNHYQNTIQIVTPTQTPLPQGSVLGISVTAPPAIPINVGGEGQLVTIAVLGDSMIDVLGQNLPQLDSALKQYYPYHKFNILNYGVGSQNIESGLDRLSHDYQYRGITIKNLISQNPDIIVVESFAYNNFGNTQIGIDRHWQNLKSITTTLSQKLPQSKIIIAATIAPNSVIFSNGIKDLHFSAIEKIEKTNTIKLYLQNTINFANSQSLPLADAYHLSLSNNEGSREFISSIDGLHPSTLGGQLFCDLIADTIKKNKLIP